MSPQTVLLPPAPFVPPALPPLPLPPLPVVLCAEVVVLPVALLLADDVSASPSQPAQNPKKTMVVVTPYKKVFMGRG